MARPVRARVLLALAAAAVTGSLVASTAPAPARAAVYPPLGTRLTGGDISWPNCPKGMGIPKRRSEGNPMPLSTATFVIVGLTNGPGFTPNPCLADQVAWVKNHHLWAGAYAVTTYPTDRQLGLHGYHGPWGPGVTHRRLLNTGYQQGLFNVRNLRAAGLDVPFIWIDVEPYYVRKRWTGNEKANRAVVRGVMRAYVSSGYRVGFYSYEHGWRQIVGAWRKPAYPTWVPAGGGPDGYANARAKCRAASFSGGRVVLAQWVEGRRDRDVTCPGTTGRPARPHPTTPYIDVRLHLGSQGKAVLALQRALSMWRKYQTGRFGPWTRTRLMRYQQRHGLRPSGVTTRATWRELGAGSVVPAQPSRMPRFFKAY